MTRACLKCGKEVFGGGEFCAECGRAAFGERTTYPPEAGVRDPHSSGAPFRDRFAAGPIEHQPGAFSSCPYCGGAGGVFTKSTITTGGFVYMGVMFVLAFFAFFIFFPCAIVPFALLFLGLLFREKHLACVNCRMNLS